MVELLDRGVRHAPVVDRAGVVLGVLEDFDLLATDARLPFRLRRSIADARDRAQVAEVAAALPDAVVVAVRRRAGADADLGRRRRPSPMRSPGACSSSPSPSSAPPPVPVSWLALGSIGRRESVLSSDVDTALVWHGDDGDPELRRWATALGARRHGAASTTAA